jgi:hypothetical protein
MKISLEGYSGGSLTRGNKLVVYMLIRYVVLNVGLMFRIFVSGQQSAFLFWA